VRSWIDYSGEVVWDPSLPLVAQLVEASQPFWLDIENASDEVLDQLAELLGLHPLAVEGSKQFGQRAKLQVYGNGALLVGFGLDEQLREPVEVHASLASKHLAVVSRRLAAVATIFLPISFLAGFWGQNFNVLTGSIEKG
jgi:magnesium transporter